MEGPAPPARRVDCALVAHVGRPLRVEGELISSPPCCRRRRRRQREREDAPRSSTRRRCRCCRRSTAAWRRAAVRAAAGARDEEGGRASASTSTEPESPRRTHLGRPDLLSRLLSLVLVVSQLSRKVVTMMDKMCKDAGIVLCLRDLHEKESQPGKRRGRRGRGKKGTHLVLLLLMPPRPAAPARPP